MMGEVSPIKQFGEQIRREFYMSQKAVHVNHGSYGTCPRRVMMYKMRLEEELETQPDQWFRKKLFANFQEAVGSIAKFLHTDPMDTFFVQNATKGVNTVLKSFPLSPGDGILVTNISYKAIVNTSSYTVSRSQGTEVITIQLTFPINSEDDVVQLYEETLEKHPNIKLAVVDHITSSTALVLPVKRLVEACHKHGVVVVIDGAHAPGQLPLNIQSVDADFYTGNFHKWLFAPKGCAVLWRNSKRSHDWFKPVITSKFLGCGLHMEFGYEGTKDDSTYFSIVESLAFFQSLGGIEAVTQYNTDLRNKAVELLKSRWNVRGLEVPTSMQAPFMQLVKLPPIPGYESTDTDANRLHLDICSMYNIQTMVVCIQGELYLRVSAQVYNTIQDFEKLAEAVQMMCGKD